MQHKNHRSPTSSI